MAQFNVPQFNEMLFGGYVYTRTLSTASGLSTPSIGRVSAFTRALTAAIALGVSLVYKAQNPRKVAVVGTDRIVITAVTTVDTETGTF